MRTRTSSFQSRRPPLRRTAAETFALISHTPSMQWNEMIAEVPKGDRHAVLVLPAMMRGDPYTADVRQCLTVLGYASYGWNLGVNVGPSRRLLDGAMDRLIECSDAHGPVSVVGFSLGGLFARWLSLCSPHRVRQVITVCSPIHEPARNFWLPLDHVPGLWPGVDLQQLTRDIAQPLPVPGTFMFSRDDGFVNYPACWDMSVANNNIEIDGPHVLIARNKQVLRIIADRLAARPEPRIAIN